MTVRGYPGALFVSAGGYHHHVGLNTWMGEGAPPPPPGARGLDRFEVVLPAAADLDAAERRLADSGVQTERSEEGLTAVDPSGNRVLLSRAAPSVTLIPLNRKSMLERTLLREPLRESPSAGDFGCIDG